MLWHLLSECSGWVFCTCGNMTGLKWVYHQDWGYSGFGHYDYSFNVNHDDDYYGFSNHLRYVTDFDCFNPYSFS